jgi:hypothetical protein
LTINVIRAANEIIIPVEASRFSLEGLGQLIEIINLVKDRLNHNVDYKVLVTNFDSRLRHSFKMLNWIKLSFTDKLFRTIVHVNVKLKEAQNEGKDILNYDKYCRGTKDYYSLSRELISQEKVTQSAPIQTQPPLQETPTLEERMQETLKEELRKFTEVSFSVIAPDAKEVHLVGDFNNWRVDESSRMDRESNNWRKNINLTHGRYRYRFVIDGKWTEDANNPNKETNPYGEMDSLLELNRES